jgi:hypothetical protein
METERLFEGFDPGDYETEAQERWAETDAWRESQRRTGGYTKADWDAVRQETVAIGEAVAAGMDRGPGDPEVQAAVAAFHRQINQRFYECPPEVFRCLADLQVGDDRFAETWDRIRPGLAPFLQSAMHAYCDGLAPGQDPR